MLKHEISFMHGQSKVLKSTIVNRTCIYRISWLPEITPRVPLNIKGNAIMFSNLSLNKISIIRRH